MEVLHSTEDNIQQIAVSGKLDGISSSTLEAELNKTVAEGTLPVILNFGELAYISSAGLRVILDFLKKMKPAGRKVVLVADNEMILYVLKRAGFNLLLPVLSTLEEAKAKLTS
ncbi:MAG: STAS domain-containing protein [Candidatus Methylacidiphilales bacterium]|nr:STAS domain-containing protein [Candidatus Methylacidiphilales bacterium]